MYGGIFKNHDGVAFLSGDVPHLYRTWTNVAAQQYAIHTVNAVNYAGIQLIAYNITKWRVFLPSIAGVGEPVLAGMRLPSDGYHTLDAIIPTAGGWYVYGLSAPSVNITITGYATYQGYYVRKNQCGYVYARAMLSASNGEPLYSINANSGYSLPAIDAFAHYTSAMKTPGSGLALYSPTGSEIFYYPAVFSPIKARVDSPPVPAPSMNGASSIQALSHSKGSVVFYGCGQYVFDRAFYTHNTTCSYGCDGYSGCLNYYSTTGATMMLRNMVNSDGVVKRIPLKTTTYKASSYTDNSSVVGFGGSPVSSSGSSSSGYKLSTSSSNTDEEYVIVIPI